MEKINLKKLEVTIYPDDLKEIGLFIFTFKEPSKTYLVRGFEYELKNKQVGKIKIQQRKVNKTRLLCRYFFDNKASNEDFILIYPFSIFQETIDIYSINDIEKFKQHE